jgi:hypothetical protein
VPVLFPLWLFAYFPAHLLYGRRHRRRLEAKGVGVTWAVSSQPPTDAESPAPMASGSSSSAAAMAASDREHAAMVQPPSAVLAAAAAAMPAAALQDAPQQTAAMAAASAAAPGSLGSADVVVHVHSGDGEDDALPQAASMAGAATGTWAWPCVPLCPLECLHVCLSASVCDAAACCEGDTTMVGMRLAVHSMSVMDRADSRRSPMVSGLIRHTRHACALVHAFKQVHDQLLQLHLTSFRSQ